MLRWNLGYKIFIRDQYLWRKERQQNWAEGEVQFSVVLPSLSQTNWEALGWILPISILCQARMTGLSPSSLWVTGQMWAVLGRVRPWARQLLKLRHTSPTPCSKSFLEGGCGHISMSTSPPDWWQTGPKTPTLVESITLLHCKEKLSFSTGVMVFE